MIKKFKIFDAIKWYHKGKFEIEEVPDIPEIKFKVNQTVTSYGPVTYWSVQGYKDEYEAGNINLVGKVGEWKTVPPIFRQDAILEVTYCKDVNGYTGCLIKVGIYWPWFQTTNIERDDEENDKGI